MHKMGVLFFIIKNKQMKIKDVLQNKINFIIVNLLNQIKYIEKDQTAFIKKTRLLLFFFKKYYKTYVFYFFVSSMYHLNPCLSLNTC